MAIRSIGGVLRFWAALLRTSVTASMALRGTFVLQVALMALNNLIFFSFWWLLLLRVGEVRGYRVGDVAVLYGIVAVSYGLVVALAGGVRHLGRFVYDGELDALLPQPKPTLLYAIGLRSQASGIGDALSGFAMIGFSGVVGLADLPALTLAIVASGLVLVGTGILFNSLAFWFGRVEALTRQLFEALITFSLYPEPLFGGPLRLVLFTVLPAGFVGYLPARLVREPSVSVAAAMMVATVLYLGAALWVFGRGLRVYRGGSRFNTFA